MSNHRNNTTASAVSMPNAPDLDDVQATLSRLISLIELVDDFFFQFHTDAIDADRREEFFRNKNLMYVTLGFARDLDKLVDAYSEGLRDDR